MDHGGNRGKVEWLKILKNLLVEGSGIQRRLELEVHGTRWSLLGGVYREKRSED